MKLGVAMMVLMGCGACGGEAPEPEPVGAEEPAPAAPAVPAERVIPLCDGSLAQAPELCQELRYGTRGYCNFWHACH